MEPALYGVLDGPPLQTKEMAGPGCIRLRIEQNRIPVRFTEFAGLLCSRHRKLVIIIHLDAFGASGSSNELAGRVCASWGVGPSLSRQILVQQYRPAPSIITLEQPGSSQNHRPSTFNRSRARPRPSVSELITPSRRNPESNPCRPTFSSRFRPTEFVYLEHGRIPTSQRHPLSHLTMTSNGAFVRPGIPLTHASSNPYRLLEIPSDLLELLESDSPPP